MTILWVSHFIYDTKCIALKAINHPQASFGIHNIFNHFLLPHSAILPIDQNGMTWFLCSKLAKALLWHVIFRITRLNGVQVHSIPGVPLIMADLEPNAFRNAPNLPFHTLAFVKSFCYTMLVRLLKDVMDQLPDATLVQAYPTAAKVHDQAIVTIGTLLQQHDNPGLDSLKINMLNLYNLVSVSCSVNDVEWVVHQ
ncbi:hypothetical protein BDR04DRAFT_1116136 [Suillus decipiens]|nr:hypothetical protein BDR04DRAFT_1116136 [Suillus decipiens]